MVVSPLRHNLETLLTPGSNDPDLPPGPPSPSLDWSALQVGLERTDSDVLLLLDSCASAGSLGATSQFKTQEEGTTELIAACGFETRAPGPGPHSFTNALIKELLVMSEWRIFSAVMLHQSIVTRLAHYSPNFSAVSYDTWYKEQRVTPVYISGCSSEKHPTANVQRTLENFGP